jgi:hypothetical protein
MDTTLLSQEIDVLITSLGEDTSLARPAIENAVVEKIRQLLELTRNERTGASRAVWQVYLPYAAKLCFQLSKVEEGWEDALEYFASENGQFWLEYATALLDLGEISGVISSLNELLMATRMMRIDRIAQVDLLLQGLDLAIQISDKKLSTALYAEAEKLYRKHLAGGSTFTGSAWLPKIKKMGQQLTRFEEQLRRYYAYATAVSISLEADSAEDLQSVIDYLQENLVGKVKVTRRAKEAETEEQPAKGPYRARLKITLS